MSKAKETNFLAVDALTPQGHAGMPPAFQLNLKRSLRMHPVLAAFTATVVALTLLLGGLLLKTQYQASAIFSVSPVVTAVLSPAGTIGSTDVTQFDSSMQQAVETLQRADTAEAAVRSLPEGVWRRQHETVGAAAKRLQRSLSATRMGTSLQIYATLTGPRAKDTAAAMSAVAAQFLKTTHREEDGRATERVQLLKDEAARLEANLAADRTAAAELSAQLGVSRLQDADKTPQDQAVGDLRQQLVELRRAQAFAAAGLAQSGGGTGGDEANQNTTTSGLIGQINARKAQLQSQMAGMTTANPIGQQNAQELRSLDQELLAATQRRDAEQLRHQQELRDRIAQQEGQVQRQLTQETAVAVNTATKLQRYSALNNDIALVQARLGVVRDSISTTQLQANSPSRVVLAVQPTEASPAGSSRRRLALLGALPLGLLAGLLAAVLAQRQDGRIFLAVDLEQALGIRPMAVLPAEAEISDALAEQGLLRMAGSIESAYLHHRSKTFVFTASSPDVEVEELVFRVQGKLKELGYRALWLPAETLLRAERDFEALYGRGPGGGEEVRFSEVDRNGGSRADGIATQRLTWLKRDYDVVLIDAPPLLSSATAEYAVRRTDATILVAESGVTTQDELHAVSVLLEQLGASGVGAVLQDLHMRHAASGTKRKLQKAEELAARRVQREPIDHAGEWQVLHPGTAEELRVPGDPDLARGVSRVRPDGARNTRTVRATSRNSTSVVQDQAAWKDDAAHVVEESVYSATQD